MTWYFGINFIPISIGKIKIAKSPHRFSDVSNFFQAKCRYFLTAKVLIDTIIVDELCERFLSYVPSYSNKKIYNIPSQVNPAQS